MQDIRLFLDFFKDYTKARILRLGQSFEGFKDLIVAFLIVKRGKYVSSFLNSSFLILVAATLIGGPIILENNPFTGSLDQKPGNFQAAIVSYNPEGGSLSTVVSVKPRDKVIDYKVLGGDTLAAIAKRFDVSVDSLKWVNNLKSDVIKPGQIVKVPPVTGIVHKVVAGETIYTIAKKYKTDSQKIVNFPFNDFTDLDTFALSSGQTLFVPDGVIQEAPALSPTFAQAQAGVRGLSNFIWPTSGIITQYPVWYHMALDIASNSAPAILASDRGTVVFAGCLRYGYGCHVIVDHGNGYKSLYAHMSTIAVSAGQVVGQGQALGNMGATGRATGPHLHFEIRSGDTILNPQNFLR